MKDNTLPLQTHLAVPNSYPSQFNSNSSNYYSSRAKVISMRPKKDVIMKYFLLALSMLLTTISYLIKINSLR